MDTTVEKKQAAINSLDPDPYIKRIQSIVRSRLRHVNLKFNPNCCMYFMQLYMRNCISLGTLNL